MFFISKYCCVSILHVFSVYGLPSFVPILCNEVNFHYLAQMDSRSSYCLSLNAVRLREVGGYHYKRSAGGIKWQGLLTARKLKKPRHRLGTAAKLSNDKLSISKLDNNVLRTLPDSPLVTYNVKILCLLFSKVAVCHFRHMPVKHSGLVGSEVRVWPCVKLWC